jgi:hypothetical protein
MSADINPGRTIPGKKGDNLEAARIDYSDVFAEFGDPRYKTLPSLDDAPKHWDGVKCNLNPDCPDVNTPSCDPSRCVKYSYFRNEGFDTVASENT